MGIVELAMQNAYVVAILPLVAAALIAFAFRKTPNVCAGLAIGSIGLASVWAFFILFGLATGVQVPTHGEYRWLTSGDFNIMVSWSVDPLTSMMLCVVTFVSTLIQIYSSGYMHDEHKKWARYYGSMCLFTFSMLILVLADNFLLLYAGWELVGVCSYLLIGFFHEKPSAASAAKKAFITTRIGDFGLLIGILILFFATGHIGFTEIANDIASGKITGIMLSIAVILVFFGPIGKSAQFPLHVWLPDAMEGPTPVSALIHAATMVAAGVYLVAKLMPIFYQSHVLLMDDPVVMQFILIFVIVVIVLAILIAAFKHEVGPFALWGAAIALITAFVAAPSNALNFVAVIGGITALLAASIAVTQTDIKRVLAYSTVSQLGFMLLALGMYTIDSNGNFIPIGYVAGVFHLMNHAFFKAMLFMNSGSVIHAVGANDMRVMGGLRKYMPYTAITCLIGTASISGFPFITSGFWSKDEIFVSAFTANMPLFIVAVLAAMLTTFYMFRLYFMTFEGEYRGGIDPGKHPHESPAVMTLPLIILSIFSIASGWLGTPWKNWFSEFIHFTPVQVIDTAHHAVEHTAGHGVEHGINWLIVGISFGIFLIGFYLAWLLYYKKPSLAGELAKKFDWLYQASFNKFWFDEAYLAFNNCQINELV